MTQVTGSSRSGRQARDTIRAMPEAARPTIADLPPEKRLPIYCPACGVKDPEALACARSEEPEAVGYLTSCGACGWSGSICPDPVPSEQVQATFARVAREAPDVDPAEIAEQLAAVQALRQSAIALTSAQRAAIGVEVHRLDHELQWTVPPPAGEVGAGFPSPQEIEDRLRRDRVLLRLQLAFTALNGTSRAAFWDPRELRKMGALFYEHADLMEKDERGTDAAN